MFIFKGQRKQAPPFQSRFLSLLRVTEPNHWTVCMRVGSALSDRSLTFCRETWYLMIRAMVQEARNLGSSPHIFSFCVQDSVKDSCSVMDPKYTVTCASSCCTAIKLKKSRLLGSASYMISLSSLCDRYFWLQGFIIYASSVCYIDQSMLWWLEGQKTSTLFGRQIRISCFLKKCADIVQMVRGHLLL